MRTLSEYAAFVLKRMEPGRRYESQDLQAFVPDTGVERLREIMHELWVNRQVERVGLSGWRRHRSAAPHAPAARAGETQSVRPEELFDHTTFADFFK